jgi:integrase/recombinase XerD
MCPTADLTWLRRIYSRLRRAATPARDDRVRLLPAAMLFEVAKDLMRRAEAEITGPVRRRALWFRDGLLIAMLCAWAPRSRNLAATTIGSSLQRRGEVWWAAFGPEGTKNKRPIEVPLPDQFTPWIDRYIDYYWPLLACRSAIPAAGDSFWLASSGKPLPAKKIGERVSAVTKRELGRAVNPHLFRKVIPTELAIRDPAHVGVAQPLLGHADYRTTQRAYNLSRAIDAARRHQAVVQSIRAASGAMTHPANRLATGAKSTNRAPGTTSGSRRSSCKDVP